MAKYVIGLDYGTDSVSTLLCNAETGETLATSTRFFPRWKKRLYCDARHNMWRHHPLDYVEVLKESVKDVLSQCDEEVAWNVVGIAFDTTGSTPAFVDEHGTPLAMLPEFSENPNAMFILWKDHTAIAEAEEIKLACKTSSVDYSKYEGGVYSAEWFWAKAMHVLREDDSIAAKAYSIVEACEWLPALLTGVHNSEEIVRSRCACGHKAMWHPEWKGLPPEEFLASLDPKLAGYRERLFNDTQTADKPVGHLSKAWADILGLPTSVVVAGGAYDCHMGAVGAGVKSRTLVKVMNASTCDVMVASKEDIGTRCVKGICGQVDGSVIPGMIGLEAGQSSFGDVYEMFRRVLEYPVTEVLPEVLRDKLPSSEIAEVVNATSERILTSLTKSAKKIPVEQSTMIATDWINGRRSPDANQLLKGTLGGFTLDTNAPRIFRALVEATAYGTKAIIDRMELQGLEIDDVIAIGDISMRSPFVMQIVCDVINKPMKVCNTDFACSLGACMFAATAAGVYNKVEDAIAQMNSGFMKEYRPNILNHEVYEKYYQQYVLLGQFTEHMLYK